MVQDLTVLYITNNQLDTKIFNLCKKVLLKAISELPLITVSQKPLDFGENIVVGELPRSSLSINIQMMEGLKRVKTKYVAITEHDVLYTDEHFAYIPPDDINYYYNENVWLLQSYSEDKPEANGTFSIFPDRKANSQLICSTAAMIKATQERIDLMSDPAWLSKYPTGRIGEAGVMDLTHAMRLCKGNSLKHLKDKLSDYCTKYVAYNFKTIKPNIDIRHNKNLTKNRRGNHRRTSINYWGTMEDIWNLAY